MGPVSGGGAATTWACATSSSAIPRSAKASISSSSCREKGAPSAVPCTSTRPPELVMTTFMSTSAPASSTYARSNIGVPPTIPTDTAAQPSFTGWDARRPAPTIRLQASWRATQAPTMLAVLVPPSAWRTSQSRVTCCSTRTERSVTARRLRPMRRWISWVRPD